MFNSFCVCNLRLVLRSTLSFLGIQGNLVPVSHSPLCYTGGMETPLYNPKTRPPHLLSCPPDGNGQGWALQYQVSSQAVPVMATAQQCQEGPASACPTIAESPLWPSFHGPHCREGPLQMPCPRRRRGHSALQMRMYRGEGLRPRRANCHVE